MVALALLLKPVEAVAGSEDGVTAKFAVFDGDAKYVGKAAPRVV